MQLILLVSSFSVFRPCVFLGGIKPSDPIWASCLFGQMTLFSDLVNLEPLQGLKQNEVIDSTLANSAPPFFFFLSFPKKKGSRCSRGKGSWIKTTQCGETGEISRLGVRTHSPICAGHCQHRRTPGPERGRELQFSLHPRGKQESPLWPRVQVESLLLYQLPRGAEARRAPAVSGVVPSPALQSNLLLAVRGLASTLPPVFLPPLPYLYSWWKLL